DGGDALGAVAAALGDVPGGEAADGVDRQGGVFAQGFEGGPADAGGVGMGRRLADGAEDGEVAADCFGLAQLGFVVAGGGQGDIGGNGAFDEFAQSGGWQVQAEAEVAREGGVAVDQQFGAGAGAVGGCGG